MDNIASSVSECSDSNGYINKVFNVSLDMESETGIVRIRESKLENSSACQTPIREKQEPSRGPRSAGIWRILNRRRVASDNERRPHSMILPGEASIPKLSFADKVRGFKKLKSPSVFRGKVGKLSSTKLHSGLRDDTNDDSRDSPALLHSQRNILRNKGKRHSYAGYTTEFDCSLEDIDLSATLENDQLPSQQNGWKTVERVTYTKKAHTNFSNCNNSSVVVHEERHVKDSPKVPLGGRRSKGGDVWNYLRRISLIGKGSTTLLEKSFDSMHTLDKTIDSDYGSVDLECIKDFNRAPKQTGPDVKGGHFGGLFRFFNSVAETARKWRNSSRSFSPPEEERSPVGSPRMQRIGEFLHTVSVTLKSEDKTEASAFAKPTVSSDTCEVVSPIEAVSRSPRVVLKSWKACPDSSSANGFQGSVSDGTESQLTSTHTSLATIENHQRSDGPEGSSLSEPDLQFDLLAHEQSEAGSEASATTDKLKDLGSQMNDEKRDICFNREIVPDCPDEIFKALSRPPGMSPRDPPFKVVLQRCRSLPLPQTPLPGLEAAGMPELVSQPAGCVPESATVRLRNGSTRSSQRKLLRPGSGPLQVNVVSEPNNPFIPWLSDHSSCLLHVSGTVYSVC
ncbi:hypothetical protein NFI96_017086 [Prochilodus magdalenae]|nr:hypothetical protein NFI96_017086 [Prochilodus magdalenae]